MSTSQQPVTRGTLGLTLNAMALVGFESVITMGDEAKHPKKDIRRAVLLSLVIQEAVCYPIEYFAAGYMLKNGYAVPRTAGTFTAVPFFALSGSHRCGRRQGEIGP